MADDTNVQGPNLQAHVKTYDGLINMLFYGAIAVAIIAATVIWLIAK